MLPPPPPLPPGVPGFTPQLAQGTRIRDGAPGFASLSILRVTPELKAAAVNVLGSASKKDSVILHVQVPAASTGPCMPLFASWCRFFERHRCPVTADEPP